jgi:hypothetical protein
MIYVYVVVIETFVGFFTHHLNYNQRIGTQYKSLLIEMSCFMVAWCWKIMSLPLVNDEQKYDAKDN